MPIMRSIMGKNYRSSNSNSNNNHSTSNNSNNDTAPGCKYVSTHTSESCGLTAAHIKHGLQKYSR